MEDATCGCWNKTRHSAFYIATRIGVLTVWDLLMGLQEPILAVKLCKQKLTAVTSHVMGSLLAIGNSAGNVYLVELTEALYSFDKNDRNDLTSVSLSSICPLKCNLYYVNWKIYKQLAIDRY